MQTRAKDPAVPRKQRDGGQRLRIAHMGTGHTGIEGLKGILADPALELVGWYVSTPAKEGLDAGEFCGLARAGVVATRDFDALLALKPDCVFYGSSTAGRQQQAVDEVVRFLERGINVATFAFLQMVYPPAAPADMRQAIERACERGGSTFYASGSEPGVFTTTLPATLLSAAGAVTRYRELQYVPDLVAAYPVVEAIRHSMGFGLPMDVTPPRFRDGTALEWWKPNLYMIADKLGSHIDDVRFSLKTHPLERDMDTAVGAFRKGTMGAYWWELAGLVGGRPAISVEYVCLLTRGVAVPDEWPRGAPDTRECGGLSHRRHARSADAGLHVQRQRTEESLGAGHGDARGQRDTERGGRLGGRPQRVRAAALHHPERTVLCIGTSP